MYLIRNTVDNKLEFVTNFGFRHTRMKETLQPESQHFLDPGLRNLSLDLNLNLGF